MGLFRLLDTLESATKTSLSVATSCSCAGMVVASIILTGLGGKFTSLVVLMAGQSLFLALFLTMIAALVLGMGMPLPVVYILSAVLCGPAIVNLGIPVLAAHMFLVYFSAISAITPPVAVAAYAAAAICGRKPDENRVLGVQVWPTGFYYSLCHGVRPGDSSPRIMDGYSHRRNFLHGRGLLVVRGYLWMVVYPDWLSGKRMPVFRRYSTHFPGNPFKRYRRFFAVSGLLSQSQKKAENCRSRYNGLTRSIISQRESSVMNIEALSFEFIFPVVEGIHSLTYAEIHCYPMRGMVMDSCF